MKTPPFGVHTKITTENRMTKVTYHNTAIVSFCWEGLIYLKTDGFQTITTKRRMNQVSDYYDLGFGVFQKKGKWYVAYDGETKPFEEPLHVIDTKKLIEI